MSPCLNDGYRKPLNDVEDDGALAELDPAFKTEKVCSGSGARLPRKAVIVYMFVSAVAFSDTNLLAPNLTAIGHYFNFTEAQRDWKLGGELGFGYFMIGAPAALITGYLADCVDRRQLFAAILLLGKIPCLLTFFVTAYWQLLICRTLMGITIGAVSPLTASLAGDMFPVETRTAATAVWTSCTLLGTLAGQYLSGMLGPSLGWQVPFLPVGLAGLAAAIVVLLLPEPMRGRHELALKGRYVGTSGDGWQYQQAVTCRKVCEIFTIPSNLFGFVQGIPGCVPWGVIIAYFNDFLAQEKGLSVQAATEVMVVFGFANGVGSLLGGLLGQRVYNWRKGMMPVLMGLSTILGIFPTLAVINSDVNPQRPTMLYATAAAGGLLVTITGGNIRTVFLNVNKPEVRGTVFGIFCIMDDVGKGFGPVIAAALVGPMGRVRAFNICIWMWLLCGLVLMAIGCTLTRDERRMQMQLAECIEVGYADPFVDVPAARKMLHSDWLKIVTRILLLGACTFLFRFVVLWMHQHLGTSG